MINRSWSFRDNVSCSIIRREKPSGWHQRRYFLQATILSVKYSFNNDRCITLIFFAKTRTVKALWFGRMSYGETYIEIDHFSIDDGHDMPRLNDLFHNPKSAGVLRTHVFGKLFGIFFVRCSDQESSEFPPSYRDWWELMVFLVHEETGLLIDFAYEDYADISHAITK